MSDQGTGVASRGQDARPQGQAGVAATPSRVARPILFSGPMIRALLAGTKTQTRRIVKPQPEFGLQICHYSPTGWARNMDAAGVGCTCNPARAPYGWPGDLLWVKERLARAPDVWTYVADGAEISWPARRDLASKRLDYAPSIHMPKVASRLTLEITDVRVERLQDISEADAIAEGLEQSGIEWGVSGAWTGEHHSPQAAYFRLWDSINAEKAPASINPWVWAVSFKVHQQNVGALLTPQVLAREGGSSAAEPQQNTPEAKS